MIKQICFGVFLLITFSTTSVFAIDSIEKTVPWTVLDAAKVKKISQVEVSPNTKQILYSVTNYYLQDKPLSQFWVRDNETKKVVLSSQLDINTLQAAWSPDGRYISYLAPGEKHLSVWLLPVEKRRPIKLIEVTADIESYQWSPKGDKIAFIRQSLPLSESFTQLGKPEKYLEIWVAGIDKEQVPTIERVSPDKFRIDDSFDDIFYNWSPDGKKIVVSFLPQGVAPRTFQNSLGVIDIETKKMDQLTHDPYIYQSPRFSHDGKWLAFITNENSVKAGKAKQYFLMQTCLMDLHNNQRQWLADTPDQGPRMVGWTHDDKKVIVQDSHHLSVRLYELPVDGSEAMPLSPDDITITFGARLNFGGQYLGFAMESFNQAPEAYISPVTPFNAVKISEEQHMFDKKIGLVKIVQWMSDDNVGVEGVLVLPPDFKPGNPVPLIIAPHGGPTSQWWQTYIGEYENYSIPMSFGVLSSHGFAVLAPNVRGSTGYGPTFRMANYKDLGGADYKDLLSGIDYLAKAGFIDPNRVGIWGWSYGGYLSAWAISQDVRFKAAVVGAALTDLISFDGTSILSGSYLSSYLGQQFWENNNLFLQRSPIMFVQNVKTPTMIQHGEFDKFVPVTQGQQLYNALQQRKIPVDMFVYKNQGHSFDNPMMIRQAMQQTLDWFTRWLKPNAA